MERPYIICHILSALDGKITGAFMGTEAAGTVGEEYPVGMKAVFAMLCLLRSLLWERIRQWNIGRNTGTLT